MTPSNLKRLLEAAADALDAEVETGDRERVVLMEELRDAAAEIEVPAIDQVTCKLCDKPTPAATAHSHQGGFVGECCWDERLRTTS